MDVIKDLVWVLEGIRPSRIDIIGQDNSKSNYNQVYHLVKSGKLKSDEEAAEWLFQSHPGDQRYRTFKSTFKDKLSNLLFFVDEKRSDLTDLQKAAISCRKKWMAISILSARNAGNSACTLAVQLLRDTTSFEFTEISLDLIALLKYQAVLQGDQKAFQKYQTSLHELQAVRNAELQMRDLYEQIAIQVSQSLAYHPEYLDLTNSVLKESTPILEQFDTYQIHLFGRLIEIEHYWLARDFDKLLQTCDKALAFFNLKPYDTNGAQSIFLHQKLICHIHKKELEAGKAAFNNSLLLLKDGSLNWFVAQELGILLHFHLHAYQDAWTIYSNGTAHKRFKMLPDTRQESWRLFEAYFYFLSLVGQFDDPDKVHHFKLARFINQMPGYSKDKQGANVAILIVQILILTAKQQYNEVIDRIEAIQMYHYRHLHSKDVNYRTSLFLKMLLLLPKESFHPAAVSRKGEVLFKKLKAAGATFAKQPYLTEVIPFEEMWEYIINSLHSGKLAKRKATLAVNRKK